jgi:hypothetical protein
LGGYMEAKKAYDQSQLVTDGDFWVMLNQVRKR